MNKFAVLDTETNWYDQVMSIGIVICNENTFDIIDKLYYIFTPEYLVGGMFSHVLLCDGVEVTKKDKRSVIMKEIVTYFDDNGVDKIFAYNASFDLYHLPELKKYKWYDILKIASYKKYNLFIDKDADCYTSGRVKFGCGVEAMYRMLTGKWGYYEVHNGLRDSIDELEIMKELGYPISFYEVASVDKKTVSYSGKSLKKRIAMYNEEINGMTNNKISVLEFDCFTYETKYKCNECGYEWKTRTADFYLNQKCLCPKCNK